MAYTAYKILCLIGSVLEWICCNMLSSTTAVGIGIMLVVLMCALMAMYTPSDEGGETQQKRLKRRLQNANDSSETHTSVIITLAIVMRSTLSDVHPVPVIVMNVMQNNARTFPATGMRSTLTSVNTVQKTANGSMLTSGITVPVKRQKKAIGERQLRRWQEKN